MSESTSSGQAGAPGQGHAHSHGHGHGHAHDHGYGGGHGHGHAHNHDMWSGEEYLSKPGMQETALISHDSVIHALTSTGMFEGDIKKLNLLEVGCGAGAVTQHYAKSFKTVHSIDTSPSMLLSLSTRLPPQTTYALHFLSPSSPGSFRDKELMYAPTTDDNERKLPAPRAQFDVIVANLVIHHIDDLDGLMQGITGLLAPGGWVVFTEFGVDDDSEAHRQSQAQQVIQAGKVNENGSVNQPGHFHPAFTTSTITDLLSRHDLVDVHAEIRGRLPVWEKEEDWPPCLIVRGRKP